MYTLHYHHHMLLLGIITNLLEIKMSTDLHKTLHKNRNIQDNSLADAAAKLAVIDFDTLQPTQTTRVDVGEIAPRPSQWVMYTS